MPVAAPVTIADCPEKSMAWFIAVPPVVLAFVAPGGPH
jgi:hypothetical protein